MAGVETESQEDEDTIQVQSLRRLRRASSTFAESNPYAQVERRGSFFTPVEAGFDNDSSPDIQEAHILDALPEFDAPAPKTSADSSPQSSPKFSYGTGSGADKSLILHAQVFADDFVDSKHCSASGELKPRRPIPHLRASELLNGLSLAEGHWIFEGQLNGWPAYTHFSLRSLTSLTDYKIYKQVKRVWDAKDGKPLPRPSDLPKETRATFVAPTWTAHGWAEDSPGFAFWYSTQFGEPRCLYGERMVQTLEADPVSSATAVAAHTFAHRYPVEKESLEDRNTYHVGVLIEWSHGLFTTIAELAWRNGCGGYGGRANWVPDKLEPETQLFRCMAPGLKRPWNNKQTEVRLYDIDCKNKAEFEAYLSKYSEKSGLPLAEQRFRDPKVFASNQIRVRRVTPARFAEYILNYTSRIQEYNKLYANCQTFGADLFGFLSGSRGVVPYHDICRPMYKQRTLSFVYAPHYELPDQ
mmetsp:Transcript_35194/g.74921  ORF Transcript_35194/g.74921 Transcript_35194/m.74921 type:complete len:469 (+) Transcript_35194:100-1506(+)